LKKLGVINGLGIFEGTIPPLAMKGKLELYLEQFAKKHMGLLPLRNMLLPIRRLLDVLGHCALTRSIYDGLRHPKITGISRNTFV
jgi:hypothetical protein